MVKCLLYRQGLPNQFRLNIIQTFLSQLYEQSKYESFDLPLSLKVLPCGFASVCLNLLSHLFFYLPTCMSDFSPVCSTCLHLRRSSHTASEAAVYKSIEQSHGAQVEGSLPNQCTQNCCLHKTHQ